MDSNVMALTLATAQKQQMILERKASYFESLRTINQSRVAYWKRVERISKNPEDYNWLNPTEILISTSLQNFSPHENIKNILEETGDIGMVSPYIFDISVAFLHPPYIKFVFPLFKFDVQRKRVETFENFINITTSISFCNDFYVLYGGRGHNQTGDVIYSNRLYYLNCTSWKITLGSGQGLVPTAFSSMLIIGTDIYIFGGEVGLSIANKKNHTDKIQLYKHYGNSWKIFATMPNSGCNLTSAYSKGLIFVGGKIIGILVYNPEGDLLQFFPR